MREIHHQQPAETFPFFSCFFLLLLSLRPPLISQSRTEISSSSSSSSSNSGADRRGLRKMYVQNPKGTGVWLVWARPGKMQLAYQPVGVLAWLGGTVSDPFLQDSQRTKQVAPKNEQHTPSSPPHPLFPIRHTDVYYTLPCMYNPQHYTPPCLGTNPYRI